MPKAEQKQRNVGMNSAYKQSKSNEVAAGGKSGDRPDGFRKYFFQAELFSNRSVGAVEYA